MCMYIYVSILIDGLTLPQVNMWSLEDTCFHHLCSLFGVYWSLYIGLGNEIGKKEGEVWLTVLDLGGGEVASPLL